MFLYGCLLFYVNAFVNINHCTDNERYEHNMVAQLKPVESYIDGFALLKKLKYEEVINTNKKYYKAKYQNCCVRL